MNFRVFDTQHALRNILVLSAMVFALLGCASSSPPSIGSCGLETTFADDATAIEAVLTAEGTFVAQKDISALMNLWVVDGVVSDAMHTPNDPADDRRWRGTDAIRQRYVYLVFPNAPADTPAKNYAIDIDGGQAIVTGTTRIGDEVSPGGDRWELKNDNGCWVIQSLTFNLEN